MVLGRSLENRHAYKFQIVTVWNTVHIRSCRRDSNIHWVIKTIFVQTVSSTSSHRQLSLLVNWSGASQLSSTFILVWSGARKLVKTNSHTNACLPTFINFHPCLTRSKETSQNNSHTNSCLSTLINFHSSLIRSKESQNNSHTNSCLPLTFINFYPCLTRSKQTLVYH